MHPLRKACSGQPLTIRTPGHALEEGVDVFGVPQELPSLSRARIPDLDSVVFPATGQEPTIGTPCHPIYVIVMPGKQHGLRLSSTIPDGHQLIRACAGELGAATLSGGR
jgi:hypothetical protein